MTTVDSMLARAHRLLAGGVNSNARLPCNDIVLVRGEGPYVWDDGGRRYTDYLLGRGPAFLGHGPPGVLAAVRAAESDGMCLGATTRVEIEAAESLVAVLGWPDMVRFTSSGTEAVQLALRLARAATGRPKVVQFQDHYHGWVDSAAVTAGAGPGAGFGARPRTRGQSAAATADTVVVGWNDLAALRAAFAGYAGQIAAVILEPVMMNGHGTFPRPGFLEAVRAEVGAHGAVLILDEVITGLRLGPRGAAGVFGITPDLAVYAKALGSGWPVAAVAGRADLFAPVSDGTTNHGGTYNGNAAAMAAVRATLDVLGDPSAYERVNSVGTELMRGLADAARAAAVPVHIRGFPTAFFTHVTDGPTDLEPHHDLAPDTARFAALARRLRDEGVWVGGRGSWYVSTSHTLDDVRDTVRAFAAALESI